MLKIYDKAQWHIDGGEDKISVVDKLKIILHFLLDKGLLSSEGKEIVNLGVDSSISIHERMLTQEGKKFMDEYYDRYTDLIEGRVSNKLLSKGYASSCGVPSNYSYAKGDDFDATFTMKRGNLATVVIDYIDVTEMRHKFVLRSSENNWLIDEKYYGFAGEDKWYSDRI